MFREVGEGGEDFLPFLSSYSVFHISEFLIAFILKWTVFEEK